MEARPRIWIIDEEWPDYEVETRLLQEAFPGCDLRFSGNDYAADLEAFGTEADAVLCQIYVEMPRSTLERMGRCRVVSVFGGGFDRVDTQAARERGVQVTFVPGYCVEDVSDHVLASIYHANKRITAYGEALSRGIWGAQAVERPVRRICGSTLFVVGLGRIGSAAARKASALGLRGLAFDPYVTDQAFQAAGATRVSWEQGFREADFLSVHAKLTPETEGLVGARELGWMKPSATVINTARGPILDEDALVEAVRSERLAGAYLDVIRTEPPVLSDPVFHCPRILVTPHISYLSEQSFLELRTRATTNVIRVLQGLPVEDSVEAKG